MINAWTQTDTLSRTTRRQICLLVADWCVENLGTSYRGRPSIKVVKSKRHIHYGLYNPYKDAHEIVIYHDVCDNIYKLISTMLHEWTHSLQKVRKSYYRLYDEFGYDKHPMEIEARLSEKLWGKCWKDIKAQVF